MGRKSKHRVLNPEGPFRESLLLGLGRDGRVGEIDLNDEYRVKRFVHEYFVSYPLQEMRVIGWRLGVHAPTVQGKEYLLDLITDELWGVQYFSDPRSPLNVPDIKLLPFESEIDINEDIKRGELLIGTRVKGVFEGDFTGGFLRVNGYKRSTHDVGVVRRFVNAYGLRNGDIVEGNARYVSSVCFYCLHHIDEVNGVKILEPDGPQLPDGPPPIYQPLPEPVAASELITLSEARRGGLIAAMDLLSPVMRGQSALISVTGRCEPGKPLADIASAVCASGLFDKVVTVALGERKSVTDALAPMVDELLITEPGDDTGAVLVARVRDYLLRRSQTGSKVAMVINNIDLADGELHDGAVRALAAANCNASGGSLTVYAIVNADDPQGAYHRLRNVAEAELALTGDAFHGSISVIPAKCFSDCGDVPDDKRKKAVEALRGLPETELAAVLDDVMKSRSLDEALAKIAADIG